MISTLDSNRLKPAAEQIKHVFVDGILVTKVFAIEDLNTVRRYATNAEGHVYLEPGTKDVARETCKGVVTWQTYADIEAGIAPHQ